MDVAPARATWRGRRVLLLAPHLSYRSAAYQRAALRLGMDLTLASTSEVTTASLRTPGLSVPADDPDELLARICAAARRTPFDAVIATDDGMVELASRAAARLGLPHNPPAATRNARRKDLARLAQARAGLPVPHFQVVDLRGPVPRLPAERFPAVIKPLAGSGSRGVMRVDDQAGLGKALRRLDRLLAGDGPGDAEERHLALVEDFLPGTEVAVEGMLDGGCLTILAIFDKPDPLDGPFFAETYYITPSRHPPGVQTLIRERVEQVCAAYGLREGPVHAELRIGDAEVWPLEVAARTIGGDCARLLRFGAGHGLEELVLARAVGLPLDARPDSAAAGVLMLPVTTAGVLRRVEGVLAAGRVAGIEEVIISVNAGNELLPLPEGARYLGFVFARAPDPASAERALREAHAHLRVVIAPRLPVSMGPAPS